MPQAAEEWSLRLEKQRAESAAALEEARASAAAPNAWKSEKEQLLSAHWELATEKVALEKKLAEVETPASSAAESDAAVAQINRRLEEALAEKQELARALDAAKAAQKDMDAARKEIQGMQASAVADKAAAAQLREEATQQAAAELARERVRLAEAEAEKQRAAAAQAAAEAEKEKLASELEQLREKRRLAGIEEESRAEAARAAEVAAAEKARLQSELAEAADARTALEAQLGALAAELQGLRSAAAAAAGLSSELNIPGIYLHVQHISIGFACHHVCVGLSFHITSVLVSVKGAATIPGYSPDSTSSCADHCIDCMLCSHWAARERYRPKSINSRLCTEAAGDSAEENGTGTPVRRRSLGGAGPASAPASLQKSAIKGATGLGSKRVSWDPSLWPSIDQVINELLRPHTK